VLRNLKINEVLEAAKTLVRNDVEEKVTRIVNEVKKNNSEQVKYDSSPRINSQKTSPFKPQVSASALSLLPP